MFVGVLERTRDFRDKSHRLIHRKLLLAVDAVTEGLTLHVGHHVEEEAIRLAGIEERKDMGMLEVGGRLDLC